MEGIIRPESNILPESALIPARNLISPPPNQFTHEVARPLPFYYDTTRQASTPDGHFPAGTKVLLVACDTGDYCRVADARGLYVEVERAGLTKL
jgi:hypothetical protein